MTKKDYIIIADCMNKAYKSLVTPLMLERETESNYAYAIQQVLKHMLIEFPKDNQNFNWQQFKKAVYK